MNRLQEMAVKASSVALNINMMLLGQPVYTPVRYDTLIKSSYNRNVWVYACVRAISEAAASVPLVLYKKEKNGSLIEVEQHPLLDLLRNPSQTMSEIEHRQSVIAFLLLSGNSYEEIVYALGKPLELHTWRPDRTQVVPDREGIRALRYTVNGVEKDLDYQFAIHHKMFSADNDYYGISPLEVARITVDMDNETQNWNTSLLQNSGAPSGILVAPPEVKLNDDEYKRLSSRVRRLFSGIRNVGKPRLLEGGLKWEQLGLSPKDMDFVNSRRMTREEICAVFRTPPQIVGIQDKSTFNNFSEARRMFYVDAVLPSLDRLIANYNQKLLPLFGGAEGFFLSYDRDKIEALQENADQKFERVAKVPDVLMINERREALGYGRLPGLDILLIPDNMIIAGKDAHLYAQPTDDGDNEPPPNKPKPSKLDDDEPPVDDENPPNTKKSADTLLDLLEQKKKQDKDAAFVKAVDDQREKFVKKMVPRIHEKLLQVDQKRAVKVLKSFTSLTEKNMPVIIEKLEKSIDAGLSEWEIELNGILLAVVKDFATREYLRLRKEAKHVQGKLETKADDTLDAETEEVLMKLIRVYVARHVAEQIKFISRTSKDALKGIVEDGMEEGLSLGQIAKRIQQLDSTTFSKNRAYTIARTEVLSAASYANHMSAKQIAEDVNVKMEKTWLTAIDGRERDTHRAAHRQTVAMDKYYDIGGEKAMYPGDTRLSAANRIRCRCAERYTVVK